MAIMKQIEECLERAFAGKTPAPSHKWKAYIENGLLLVKHYHHNVYLYDLSKKQELFTWWEKPADKRGLDSIREWMKQR